MRHIYFAFLILGCFAQLTVAQSRTFEFTDSNGMCWRCYPGSPCVRCIPDSPRINEPPVDTWPTTCPAPDCNNPENRGIVFPSPTLRQYYQCNPDGSGGWVAEEMECPCDRLFSFEHQTCLPSWEFVPHCQFAISDPTTIECNPATGDPTGPTTAPTDDPAETTVASTTPRPCVCVIWWPCMCNPCMSWPRPPTCMMMG